MRKLSSSEAAQLIGTRRRQPPLPGRKGSNKRLILSGENVHTCLRVTGKCVIDANGERIEYDTAWVTHERGEMSVGASRFAEWAEV